MIECLGSYDFWGDSGTASVPEDTILETGR